MQIQLIFKISKVEALMIDTTVINLEDLNGVTLRNCEYATLQVVYPVQDFLSYQGDINAVDLLVEGHRVGFTTADVLNGKIFIHFKVPKIYAYEKQLERIAYIKTGKLLSVFGFPFRLDNQFEELICP